MFQTELRQLDLDTVQHGGYRIRIVQPLNRRRALLGEQLVEIGFGVLKVMRIEMKRTEVRHAVMLLAVAEILLKAVRVIRKHGRALGRRTAEFKTAVDLLERAISQLAPDKVFLARNIDPRLKKCMIVAHQREPPLQNLLQTVASDAVPHQMIDQVSPPRE